MTEITAIREREADFQRAVIDLARIYRWKVAHFRPARTKDGWRTPVAADGRGFPDLVLVRDRVIFVELKTDRGMVSDAQADWISALHDAGQHAFVWRPCQWPEIEKALR